MARERPGYTKSFGDTETSRRVAAGEDVGVVLESQRQQALSTPTLRDDQFFANELSKWAENKVEESSAFHHLTKDEGVSVKENPREIQGDLAVEFLKGSPDKRSEQFSPLSGRMKQYLPGDRGLQETSWDAARTGRTPPGSYMRAIEVINSSSGGFATGKVGTPNRTSINTPVDSFGGRNGSTLDESNAKRPFVSAEISRERVEPTGELPFVGVVPVISPALARAERGLQDAGITDKQMLVKRTTWSPAEDQFNVVDRDPDTGAYGAAYTRALINDKGQKSLEATYTGPEVFSAPVPVGAPRVTTKYNELTGETETITEQDYQRSVSREETAFKLSPLMVGNTTGEITTEKGAVTRFEDTIRSKLPAGTMQTLEMQERILGGMAEKSPAFTGMALGASEVKSLAEHPVGVGISYGSGFVFGGAVRGAGAVVSRVGKAAPVAGKVLTGTGRVGGGLLALGYGADVASRSTEGFQEFSPVRVAQRATPIITLETLPMAVGFGHGNALPEITRAGYTNVKTTVGELPTRTKAFARSSYERATETAGGIRKNIPTVDQIKYKWVEIREPGSAMSTPAASERFGFTDRARGITNSNKWVEAQRISMRGSGTRTASERGSISGRPTPRQESLRLNYNPTSPLKEINTNIATASRAKNILSGIRGTLKGKWDTASAAADEFAHLPLKERWKARSASKEQPGAKGYFGSGKPAGGLQSGVGEFGTTVRSGRQSLEIRSASSGINAEIESFAPQRLEITPSRQTAQRSRAFDMDFEYEGRRLPSGMQRPQPAQGQAITPKEIQAQNQNMRLSPVFDVIPQQRSQQVLAQRQGVKASPFTSTRFSTKEELRSDQKTESSLISIQTPISRSILGVGTASISALVTRQGQRQVQKPESILTQSPITDSSRITRSRPDRITTRSSFTDIITPEPPKTPGLPFLPGGSGSSGDRPFSRQGSYGWSNLNPVGADILTEGGGGAFGDPFSSSGGRGSNAKCRHKTMKAKLNCSRFWRNG